METAAVSFPPLEAEIIGLLALAVMLAAALAAERRTRLAPARRALLALLMAAAIVISTESVLRLYGWLRPGRGQVPRPVIGWTFAPNLRDIRRDDPGGSFLLSTNSLGLRSEEIPFQRSPAEFRILCIGDSWTYGMGVATEDIFCTRLQRLLSARYPALKISVINAGHPGFNYFQGYHLLDQLLPLYQPDLVMMCGFNVLANQQIPEMEEALPTDPLLRRVQSTLQESYAYLLLRKEIFRVLGAPTTLAAGHSTQSDRAWAMRRYLAAIAARIREAGLPSVFFEHAFRPFSEVRGEPDFVPCLDPLIAEVGDAADRAVVTICPVTTADQERACMQPRDPGHPSARAHARMAAALFRLLNERGFVRSGAIRP